MKRVLGICVMSASLCAAQSMMETSAAATGGSAGGVAGKTVSDGFDKILGIVSALAQTAGNRQDGAESRPPVPPGVMKQGAAEAKAAEGSAAASGAAASIAATISSAFHAIGPPNPLFVTGVAEPPVLRSVSPEALARIEVGTGREKLLAAAGSPASRIVMEDGGHLVELCRYTSQGETIAWIDLTDGAVSRVRVRGRE